MGTPVRTEKEKKIEEEKEEGTVQRYTGNEIEYVLKGFKKVIQSNRLGNTCLFKASFRTLCSPLYP